MGNQALGGSLGGDESLDQSQAIHDGNTHAIADAVVIRLLRNIPLLQEPPSALRCARI